MGDRCRQVCHFSLIRLKIPSYIVLDDNDDGWLFDVSTAIAKLALSPCRVVADGTAALHLPGHRRGKGLLGGCQHLTLQTLWQYAGGQRAKNLFWTASRGAFEERRFLIAISCSH